MREALPVFETALVVVVPQADALVVANRQPQHPGATAGLPAHVTVLYPFRLAIDDEDAALIGELASKIPAFDVTFARSGRFPRGFVYLVPEPAQPFLDLTAALVDAFPDCPPYGGAYDQLVPHLTVADGLDQAAAASLQADLAAALPIVAPVTHLTLLQHERAWRAVRQWPLGSASAEGVSRQLAV